jgi:hypothetical protein
MAKFKGIDYDKKYLSGYDADQLQEWADGHDLSAEDVESLKEKLGTEEHDDEESAAAKEDTTSGKKNSRSRK